MEQYLITLNTIFEIDGEKDSLEMTCPAQYFYSDNEARIEYDEYGEDGAPTHTVITVFSNTVEIHRSGAMQLNLLLREGMEGSDRYELGENMIIIDYFADRVCASLSQDGGTLNLAYRIDFGGMVSKNTMLLSVKRR